MNASKIYKSLDNLKRPLRFTLFDFGYLSTILELERVCSEIPYLPYSVNCISQVRRCFAGLNEEVDLFGKILRFDLKFLAQYLLK